MTAKQPCGIYPCDLPDGVPTTLDRTCRGASLELLPGERTDERDQACHEVRGTGRWFCLRDYLDVAPFGTTSRADLTLRITALRVAADEVLQYGPAPSELFDDWWHASQLRDLADLLELLDAEGRWDQ